MLLNSFSHELRTPINCAMQLLDMLQSKLTSQELLDQFVIPSLNSIKLLSYQFNDILDFASFETESFSYHFTKFSITSILMLCKELYATALNAKNLKLLIKYPMNEEVIFYNDHERIVQVLVNLLNNAIKFTQKNGIIQLGAKQIKHNLIKFKVKDNGVGIDPAKLQILKQNLLNKDDSFSSVQTYVANYNQIFTGLGLKTASKIVDGLLDLEKLLLKSNLQIQSTENSFTKISFLIQDFSKEEEHFLEEENSLDSENKSIQSASQGACRKMNTFQQKTILKKAKVVLMKQQYFQFMIHKVDNCRCSKILVVDDVPFNHQAISVVLNCFNQQNDSAFDGQEAVDKVKEKMVNPCGVNCRRGYFLILMDIQMPVMDGYEASQKIKEYLISENNNFTRIVVCSAYDQDSHKKNEGIDDYLPKPVNRAKLLELLKPFMSL